MEVSDQLHARTTPEERAPGTHWLGITALLKEVGNRKGKPIQSTGNLMNKNAHLILCELFPSKILSSFFSPCNTSQAHMHKSRKEQPTKTI
jgi:hypothetical protein